MRRLFISIFLRFWLTIVIVGVGLVISTLYAANTRQSAQRAVIAGLKGQAATVVALYERAGAPAVRRYVNDLQRTYVIRAFLFASDGREMLENDPPPNVRSMATVALGEDGLHVRESIAGQRVASPSGAIYALVLSFGETRSAIVASAAVFQLPIVVLIGGAVFCYAITRHITAPLSRLRAAVTSIAEGHLDTRVGPVLGRRRDEIADLGRDIDRMAGRIESLVTQQRRLLGDVSHELRSPLTRLVVALSLIKQGSPTEAPEHLERIGLEARRLDELIGQLLTLSRIDSGIQIGVRTSVDLTNLVYEVANDADFEARAGSKRVLVTAVDACTVVGFEELLRSAVENVVRNAVRHTPEGRSVELSLQWRQGSAGTAILRVRDHGPGVPELLLSEIFLPFRRVLTPPADPGREGAGLGLAITERAISIHGGTVRAMNASAGGLMVEVELPVNQRAEG
jgi:two-component system sensor histidine kinase CpxA